jgi:hypothetical protein
LQQADNIFYVEPDKWSNLKMKAWTEDYLQSFFYVNGKTITGFKIQPASNKDNILALADTRKTSSNQLWVAGCSITAGIGVGADQRYSKLITDYFNLPISDLSALGTSIRWQADQILRSDIKKDDLLIWGLTGIHRTARWNDSTLSHYTINNTTSPVLLEYLTSDQIMYDAVVSIYQVLNFCTKIGCKLILASLLTKGIEPYLHDCKNFIGLHEHFGKESKELYADLGDDNKHPGPVMHQYYAREIIKKYYSLYGENK